MRRQDPNRLVFLDEAGANLAMGRSHVWVKRGEESVEPRPMNWGDNLTLVGAIRRAGWVVLSTKWKAMNRAAFIAWVQRRLAPQLRRGDIGLLDNLQAHRAPEVRVFIETARRHAEAAAALLARLQSHRTRVEPGEATHSGQRATRAPGLEEGRARRAPRHHALSWSAILRPCRVRQLKWASGPKIGRGSRNVRTHARFALEPLHGLRIV